MARRKPWYQTLFERDYYDYFYPGGPRGDVKEEDMARMADAQVDFIAKALALPEGARVLDLCCGWGRHSVPLAQRGYRVTGLDLSAHHLRLAKAAARRAGVEVELVRGDMREPPRGPFDGVINCFTSFGYFDTEEEDQRVLEGVARALKRGGRFLLDTMNHDRLMRVFRDSEWQERPDGGLNLERRRYDILTGRINVDWIFLTKDGQRRKQYHSVRLYTYTELAALLERAGLRVVHAYGGFDDGDLSMQSNRMVVVAERADGEA